MCLDCSSSGVVLWLQSSWLGGRHLREETCWQSAADLKSCSLKCFWRTLLVKYQGSRSMIMSRLFLALIGWNCAMVLKLVLDGHNNNTHPVPSTVALTTCKIFSILAVKKDANSLHALVDRCSEAIGTGGVVSLSTVVIRARALLLFVLIISEKKDGLDFFSSTSLWGQCYDLGLLQLVRSTFTNVMCP